MSSVDIKLDKLTLSNEKVKKMDLMTKWQLELFKDYCHQMLNSFRVIIREQANASKTGSATMFFLGAVAGMMINPMEKYIHILIAYACFLITFFIHKTIVKRLKKAFAEVQEVTKLNPYVKN